MGLLSEKYIKVIIRNFNKKEEEKNSFEEALSELCKNNEIKSRELVEQYKLSISNPTKYDKRKEILDQTIHDLMELETTQMELFTNMIDQYDDKLDDIFRLNTKESDLYFGEYNELED